MLLSSPNLPGIHLHPTHSSLLLSVLFRSTVRHADSLWKCTHSTVDSSSFKSLHNNYHKLILTSKQQYYSNFVSSASHNPKRLWQIVNKLLHCRSSSPLHSSSPGISHPDRFASFFTDKISKLPLFLARNPATSSSHILSPPAIPAGF